MKRILILFLTLTLLLSGCGIVFKPGTICDSHSDTDHNGTCDMCGESVLTTFDFYCINDLHGKVVDGENHPGVDELTTFLENARETDDNVIVLSAGDMWQGSSESNLTYGALVTEWMNDVGFAAMTIGNHEYDWGEVYIESNAQLAQFPFLAINIYDRTTNTLADYCQPSVVVDADGIQIGIIGAIGDCYSSISGDKVEDVYFKTGADLTQLVKDESNRLRENGVDFVVYVLHDGHGRSQSRPGSISIGQLASYYDISLSDGYVDLVFEGHTHQGYLLLDASGVYHMQNRGDNKGGISHVEVRFNTVTGDHLIEETELISTDTYQSLADDEIVAQLLEKYEEQIAPAYQILGINGAFRSGDELRQLVADLYYEAGQTRWGDEYEIILAGGFLSVRSPYNLDAGEVSYSQLQSLFPFDNELVLCSVSGRDLLNVFVNTNNGNYFICCNPALQVLDVEPDGVYYVVVDSYTSSYKPNRLTEVARYQTGIYARDLLAEYIKSGAME